MSGGHYGMITNCYSDAQDLMQHLPQIEEMADDLAALGYAEDAARETYELLVIMRQFKIRIETIHKRLVGVWHSRDYWVCGDRLEEDFKESLVKYRGNSIDGP